MKRLPQVLLFAVICALFWCSTAYGQTMPPTLARLPATEGWWVSPPMQATVYPSPPQAVLLGTLPITDRYIEVEILRHWSWTEYGYENLSDTWLGVQAGTTSAYHKLRFNGQYGLGLGIHHAWSCVECPSFDGTLDGDGTSGLTRDDGTAGAPSSPAKLLIYPYGIPWNVTYEVETSCLSSTWPSGHLYPLWWQARGQVLVRWRML